MAACYKDSEPYNSTLKSWISLFTSRQRIADLPNVAGTEIGWLLDFRNYVLAESRGGSILKQAALYTRGL